MLDQWMIIGFIVVAAKICMNPSVYGFEDMLDLRLTVPYLIAFLAACSLGALVWPAIIYGHIYGDL